MVGISNRGAGDGLGLRFLWIHPLGWLKTNIRTILVLPDSGRLRFPRNIWVGAGGGVGEGHHGPFGGQPTSTLGPIVPMDGGVGCKGAVSGPGGSLA